MQIWETDLQSLPQLADKLTVCLGYFDGLHLGHQSLIRHAISSQQPTALFTFDRNPKPQREARSLTPLKKKKQILEALGIQHLIIATFQEQVMKISASEFLDFLFRIGARTLVCGPDFTFGFQAQGNVKTLMKDSRFRIEIVPYLQLEGVKISTSTIVQHLQTGNLEKIPSLLGRPYAIEGFVGKGLGEGRKMGYPTANIVLDAPYFLPKNGVYITLIKIDGATYYSLASLGFHPTIANLDHPTLEVFVINYQGNLYEKFVEVAFLKYLRPEQKFPSKEALIHQMDLDRNQALALQAHLPKDF